MKRKNPLDMLSLLLAFEEEELPWYVKFVVEKNIWILTKVAICGQISISLFLLSQISLGHSESSCYNQYTHWCFLKLTVYRYDLIYLHFQNTEISTTCFEMIKTNKLQSIHPLKNTRNVWHKTILLGAEKNKIFKLGL